MTLHRSLFAAAVAVVAVGCSGSKTGGSVAGSTASPTGSSTGSSAASSGAASGTSGASSGGPTAGSTASAVSGASSGGAGVGSGGGTTGNASGTSGTTGGTPPSVCTPGTTPDPCAPYGLVCTLQDDGSGACAKPTELEACEPSVGCQTSGTTCTELGSSYYCVRPCSTTADCPQPFSTCQASGGTNYCLYDVCSSGYYGTCNAIGTNDGTCVPAAGATTVGACLQNGPQADQSVCQTTRGAAGDVSNLCVAGEFCIPDMVGSGTGTCEPICAVQGPSGPSCASGDFCWAIDQATLDWGVCLQSCTGNAIISNCDTGYCLQLGSQKGCLP